MTHSGQELQLIVLGACRYKAFVFADVGTNNVNQFTVGNIIIVNHQGLDPLISSVSRVTAARANVSSVFQLFSFLVVCSGMISKGFGCVAFFASVKASSVCIHLSCLVCL